MKILLAISFALAVSACGKKGGAPATETKPLGDSGFVVDAPKSWTVDSPMKGFYGFGKATVLQIMQSSSPPPANVDELVERKCKDQNDVTKESLPSGGFFVQCKGPSKMIKGFTTTKIQAVIPTKDGQSIECGLETDKDDEVKTAAGVCRSLRLKA